MKPQQYEERIIDIEDILFSLELTFCVGVGMLS